jgi:hypothetical protein
MSGKIDDPIDAAFQAFPEEPEDFGSTLAELALSLSSLAFLPAALMKIAWDQFRPASREDRVKHLMRAFYVALKDFESQIGSDREKMKEVREKIESPRFEEAVRTACEESARSASTKTVQRMAEVLAGSLSPTQWSPKDEDVAALIREVAQLGDRDVQVLAKLGSVFGGLMIANPKLNENRIFTDNNSRLDEVTQIEGDRDEFYSTCGRLIGFGLAVEVAWPMNHTQPHERCVRPTRRGLALLRYLKMLAS